LSKRSGIDGSVAVDVWIWSKESTNCSKSTNSTKLENLGLGLFVAESGIA
jgi:hypothetical protein